MAGLYKRGKNWYVKYYSDGTAVRKSLGKDKRTALEYKSQLETLLSRKQLGLPVYKYAWDEYVKKYLDYSRTNKALRSTETDVRAIKSLERIVAPRATTDITPLVLEKWKSVRSSEVSPTTVNIELRQIKALVNKAIQWGYMDKKQIDGVKQLKVPKKPIRFLSELEIKKLKSDCPDKWWNIFAFLIFTGLRIGELIHSKWSWVDFEKACITIQPDGEWSPKDYECREIPLHPKLMEMLYVMNDDRGCEYIFWNGVSAASFKRQIEQKLNDYCEKSGIEHCRVHDLRHTFASHLVANSVDLIAVRDLLGHTSVKTTEIYAHLRPHKHREAIAHLAFC